jgi:endonuclease V-like protein UPF0215 family
VRLSHVIGVDDAPFDRAHRGDVMIVGAAFSGLTLQGIVSGRVRRDGANATRALAALVRESPFADHTQALLLQGIALAGFNVVDLAALHHELHIPIIVVSRRAPDLSAIRSALLHRVRGGRRKWALVEQAGLMQPLGATGLHAQLAGISPALAAALVSSLAINGKIPEPLRVAHLIAGGVTRGYSTGRA